MKWALDWAALKTFWVRAQGLEKIEREHISLDRRKDTRPVEFSSPFKVDVYRSFLRSKLVWWARVRAQLLRLSASASAAKIFERTKALFKTQSSWQHERWWPLEIRWNILQFKDKSVLIIIILAQICELFFQLILRFCLVFCPTDV